MSQNEDEDPDKRSKDDAACGFWIFKFPKLQHLASKKVLIVLFGLSGCCFSATFSYFNGTITTMEKRFRMPSRTTGIISVGNDITKLLASVVLNYYASRGHRPRWISFGLCCVMVFCFLNALPHLLYGPGEDALRLTVEHAANKEVSPDAYRKDDLCLADDHKKCQSEEGNTAPPVIWFVSQFISGIGGVLFYSLGYSYLDDNIKKSKSPIAISSTYIMRMIGPAAGYGLVSICLKLYIAPGLTPIIDNSDPRWLGAWWLGWILLGVLIFVCAILVSLLPKTLPRAAARREVSKQNQLIPQTFEEKASMKDMLQTVRRLLKNRVYVLNQLCAISHIIAYVPFKTFFPKYIETQYKKSASTASFVTGTVGLVFAAVGIMVAGFTVQKIKPKARHMALWNTGLDAVRILGIVSYLFLGCPAVDRQASQFNGEKITTTFGCNSQCNCDFVKFSPVCGVNNQTFISPCHAGCTEKESLDSGKYIYTNCSCVQSQRIDASPFDTSYASSGSCSADCDSQFYAFIAIICIIKFVGSLGRITSFLVSIRCVEERDKTVSLGISLAAVSLFALIPAPIFFGYIIDSTCLVWGKTCKGTGNCWFFDSVLMRRRLVFSSTFFLLVEIVIDLGIWHGVKDLNVFEDSPEALEMHSNRVQNAM